MNAMTDERRGTRNGVSREKWIVEARKLLTSEGVASVKVDRLAKQLNVTRGGFYWRFKNREDLLEALLDIWERTNTASFLLAVGGEGDPAQRFRALGRLWLEETEFDPALDSAIRNWSQTSPQVERLVRRTDEIRIYALQRLFHDAGFALDEALVRARITYFHQIGYYAVNFQEPRQDREELSELYFYVLTGFTGQPERKKAAAKPDVSARPKRR